MEVAVGGRGGQVAWLAGASPGYVSSARLAEFSCTCSRPRWGVGLLARRLEGCEPEGVNQEDAEGFDGSVAVQAAPPQQREGDLAESDRVRPDQDRSRRGMPSWTISRRRPGS